MPACMKLLGLSGSLRAGSHNTAVLAAMASLVPEGTTLTIHDWRDVPMFDADQLTNEPAPVKALKDAIAEADGVVIVSPEYNYSIPGPLKNALDWASRPGYQSVFKHKPVAVLGASPGVVGTARGQQHLKVVLMAMLAEVYPQPEICIGNVAARFDAEGKLQEDTAKLLRNMLAGFVAWAAR